MACRASCRWCRSRRRSPMARNSSRATTRSAEGMETNFYIVVNGEIELNAGRRTRTIVVANTGDRPVQVGSHAHFFEVNRELRFDREAAYGMRLDIPAGTAK